VSINLRGENEISGYNILKINKFSFSLFIFPGLHHPTQPEYPESVGFNAPAGRETSVLVRTTQTNRLPAPFQTNCSTEFPLDYRPFKDPFVEYSAQECSGFI
jgi:hypothetical protein